MLIKQEANRGNKTKSRQDAKNDKHTVDDGDDGNDDNNDDEDEKEYHRGGDDYNDEDDDDDDLSPSRQVGNEDASPKNDVNR